MLWRTKNNQVRRRIGRGRRDTDCARTLANTTIHHDNTHVMHAYVNYYKKLCYCSVSATNSGSFCLRMWELWARLEDFIYNFSHHSIFQALQYCTFILSNCIHIMNIPVVFQITRLLNLKYQVKNKADQNSHALALSSFRCCNFHSLLLTEYKNKFV